ncbi:MAG TPA: hypothetical protein VGQ79_08900 [Nitrospiraceae bacterium]|jgi:hypothetical protein|nr:hypothetical protein [Nitrospiraceae bacterium]
MTKKHFTSSRRIPKTQPVERLLPPQWVQDMHKHFGENGFYRAEDLQRVLGDPRESVQVKASNDLLQLSRNHFDKK